MALFERNPLPQDTGRLQERWQQDGATPRSATLTVDAGDGTVLTVTSGKKFYCKTLFWGGGGSANTLTIKDGGSGGTDKLTLYGLDEGGRDIIFNSPIIFETDVYMPAATGIWHVTVVGWEEDA